jgi:hypothetical protein
MDLSAYGNEKWELEQYEKRFFDECVALLAANTPASFAPNEKADYVAYLEEELKEDNNEYFVVVEKQEKAVQVVAAFGMNQWKRIHWIMAKVSNQGLGRYMMTTAIQMAESNHQKSIDIAASHLSAPFFEKFGAKRLNYIEHGWGQDMHRIDMILELKN